jgi:hypothetical protein
MAFTRSLYVQSQMHPRKLNLYKQVDTGARDEAQKALSNPLFRRVSSLSKILAQSVALLVESRSSNFESALHSTVHQLEELSSIVGAVYYEKQLKLLSSDDDVGMCTILNLVQPLTCQRSNRKPASHD